MDNRKWLKRKYPFHYDKVNKFLSSDKQLKQFKEGKYKLGILTEDIIFDKENKEIYPKGSLAMFKRSNPVNSYNYPMHTITVKNINNITQSGYHCLWITPNVCEEIKPFLIKKT